MRKTGGYIVVEADHSIGLVAARQTYPTVKIDYGSGALSRDTATHAIAAVSKPAYLASYIDPVFGTTVTRITGDVGSTIPTIGGTWPDAAHAGYNSRPAWNADESRLFVDYFSGVGGGTYSSSMVMDGSTYAPLYSLVYPTGALDTQWHPTNPALMTWCGNGTVGNHVAFGTYNPATSTSTLQLDIAGYSGATVGGTGRWSMDGSVVAVAATRASDSKGVVFAVNLKTGTKYSDIQVDTWFGITGYTEQAAIDYVSISPLGDLIQVNGALTGYEFDTSMIFDINANVIQTWTEYGVPSHGDLGISVAGKEVVVGVCKTATQGVTEGHIIMRDMRTGVVTDLDTGGYPEAASTLCTGMPGWIIVDSVGTPGTGYPPYNDEIIAMKLDGSKTCVRLGQAHSIDNDYYTQGFVAPSPSGTRIVFTSTFEAAGTPSRPAQVYVLDLRPILGLH